jgi:hypothetical protein
MGIRRHQEKAMNAFTTLVLGGLAAASIGHVHGAEAVPAWQEPGYVMDEIVVAMQEIIVTAPAPPHSLGQEVLAELSAAIAAHLREIVIGAPRARILVTKNSSNGRIHFARWRI